MLDNGKRVMAQREVVRMLTGNLKGGIDRYLSSNNLQPYISKDRILSQTIHFQVPGTTYEGHGYEATLLLDICDAYLKARFDGVLVPVQDAIAGQAEIITRACAKVGIIALIDEATGYQSFKEHKLQLKLQAFIARSARLGADVPAGVLVSVSTIRGYPLLSAIKTASVGRVLHHGVCAPMR